MISLEDILDGFERELALERELGAKTVDIDPALLEISGATAVSPEPAAAAGTDTPPGPEALREPPDAVAPRGHSAAADGRKQAEPLKPSAPPASAPRIAPAASGNGYDFVFLAEKPFSPNGDEMLRKIVLYMHKTPETAPVFFEGEMPQAKIYIVLGSGALKKWFPGRRAGSGSWFQTDGGRLAAVTRSPDRVFELASSKQTLERMKREMLAVFKTVLQRIGLK